MIKALESEDELTVLTRVQTIRVEAIVGNLTRTVRPSGGERELGQRYYGKSCLDVMRNRKM